MIDQARNHSVPWFGPWFGPWSDAGEGREKPDICSMARIWPAVYLPRKNSRKKSPESNTQRVFERKIKRNESKLILIPYIPYI